MTLQCEKETQKENQALADCLNAAKNNLNSRVRSAETAFSNSGNAYIDDYNRSQDGFALADTIQTAGIFTIAAVATYGVSAAVTGPILAGSQLSVTVSSAGLAATTQAFNAGRNSAAAVGMTANWVAQAERAHAWNTLVGRTLSSAVIGGGLSGLFGGSEGALTHTIGITGDLLINPGRSFGPGSFLVNAASVIAPVAERMSEASRREAEGVSPIIHVSVLTRDAIGNHAGLWLARFGLNSPEPVTT